MDRIRTGLTYSFVALATLSPLSGMAQKAETVESLRAEMQAAQQKFVAEYQKSVAEYQEALKKAMEGAKTEEEKQEVRKKFGPMKAYDMSSSPVSKFAPRFLAFAEKNPKDPTAIDALNLALGTSGGSQGKSGVWGKAINLLRTRYVAKPEIKQVIRPFSSTYDTDSDALLSEIIRQNPDRKVQALALKARAGSRKMAAQVATAVKQNPAMRPRIEEQLGRSNVEFMVSNSERLQKESEEFQTTIRTKYSDILPNLAVGQPAPEVVSRHLDGSTARLSDLKGKVVVLDIWATWCGPCRQMIPHEREMVERLKEKSFALISISADEQLKTLTDFLEKEKMPWTHWWNGNKGGILEAWDVEYFPTIYVLDASGVIRHKDLRGEELEKAVNVLLAEKSAKGQ